MADIDTGNTAWVLISAALVYLMSSPALAFFYSGLVDTKNILNQLFLSVICMGIVTIQWTLFGYSFAFSENNDFWGNFQMGAIDVTAHKTLDGGDIPLYAHAAFQASFAVITPAIISGAIVGRMKFLPYCVFVFLWTTLVYDPICYWNWSTLGWLRNLHGTNVGAIDFAGGTVVHISSAVAALVSAIFLGPRHGYEKGSTTHFPNIPFVVLGASLLWIGWLGFNGGSALAANSVAALALFNTNASAAAALTTWVIFDAIRGTISLAGACCGIVVGLVAITPACGFVHPGFALFIGIIAVAFVYPFQQYWKKLFEVDDTLDVFPCHGVGGIVGSFLTGLFADSRFGGVEGAFYGRGVQLAYQLADIATVVAWSGGMTFCILTLLHFSMKLLGFGSLRLDTEHELAGLDKYVHGESWAIITTRAEELSEVLRSDKISSSKSNLNGVQHNGRDHIVVEMSTDPQISRMDSSPETQKQI